MTAMASFNRDLGAQRVSPGKTLFLRPPLLLSGALILLLAGGVYGILKIALSPAPPKMKQVVHEISLLPPPSPPPVQQPPQPEIKEEVNIPEPEPVLKEDAPPPGDLGVNADANGNGSDGFQLRARKGGRDILAAGSPFAWYTSRIEDSIKKVLSAHQKARNANYSLIIKLWLNPDGSVERFELADSTGDSDLDRSIQLALAKVEPLGSELPPDLKQPVKLRIVSRQ